jgi:para-nitrobenzyl esterase
MLGAGHALDVPFFFNYWSYFGSPGPFTEANRPGFEALGGDIISYLASFTRTGIPHNPDGTIWEPWSNETGGPKRILFDADNVESIISMSNE